MHAIDTPERRAAFEERLEKLLGEIGNARVKDHYRREVKNRLFNLWREKRTRARQAPGECGRSAKQEAGPTPLPSSYGFVTTITLALVNHPWLLDRFADEVASLDIKDKRLAALLQSVTGIIFEDTHVTRERLAERLEAGSHGKVFAALSRDSAFKRVAFLQPESPEQEVAEQFADLIYRFRALPSLNRELQEGADHLADMTEAEFERFAMLQQQVASVGSRHAADDAGDRDASQALSGDGRAAERREYRGSAGAKIRAAELGPRPHSCIFSTVMSQIRSKKILLSGASGLDSGGPPRQFMLKTCKHRAGLGFWGGPRQFETGFEG